MSVPLNVIVGIPSHEQPTTIAVYRHADTVDWLLAESRWCAVVQRVAGNMPIRPFPWEEEST